MKGRSISVIGILAAIVGAVFIIFHATISIWGLTLACGALFVLVGICSIIFFNSMKDENYSARVMSMISHAAAIVLGVSMLVFVGTFVKLIAFMLGLLVAVCALWQFFLLAVGARPYQLPSWLYIFPIALLGGAVYIYIIKDTAVDAVLLLATGIALAVLGISCIIEGSSLGMARRKELAKAKQAEHEPLPQDSSTSDEVSSQPEPEKKRKVETTEDLDDY